MEKASTVNHKWFTYCVELWWSIRSLWKEDTAVRKEGPDKYVEYVKSMVHGQYCGW